MPLTQFNTYLETKSPVIWFFPLFIYLFINLIQTTPLPTQKKKKKLLQ